MDRTVGAELGITAHSDCQVELQVAVARTPGLHVTERLTIVHEGVELTPVEVITPHDGRLHLVTLPVGHSVVTYEAQGCGAIPVVSDAAGAQCEHLITGMVHKAGDVEMLAQHFSRLIAEPQLVVDLHAAGLDDQRPRLPGRPRAQPWRDDTTTIAATTAATAAGGMTITTAITGTSISATAARSSSSGPLR